MRKRRLALLLTLAMILSLFPINAFATEFSDMPDDWSTKALENAVANGLLKGDNGKIMPNEKLTRAQMATIVNRAFGTGEKTSIDNFTDVKKDAWYYDEMAKAVQMKTFIGSGDKLYPDNSISREEAFIVLARAFKLSGGNANILDKFTDKNDISDWAREGISSLVAAGYISGSDGRINPKHNITRAEFAQVMYNLLKNYINKEGTYTEDYSGNLMINVPNVTLKGLTVTGDLIIGDGVGDGEVTLDDVTVTGRVLVRGGGENSIKIIGNSNIKNIIIARVDGIVRIYAEDGTEIGEVIVDGNDDVIIEGGFTSVTIVGPDITVTATNASIESASIEGENSNIIIDENSSVKTINVNASNVEINGEGTVESVIANANNVEVKVPGASVTAGEGTTGVTAGDKPVEPGKTETVPKEETTSSGGSSGSSRVAVSAISVTPKELTLTVGETGQITATVSPANASNKKVNWSSSDEDVATVDGNGKVTAVGYGIATITVTSAADNTKAATCKVIVANDWSDLADTIWYGDSQTSFTISTAAELAGLAELVNSGTNFSGKTINLGADIDLLNLEWIPIGTKENPFRGKFNGADKEISNLKIDAPEATNVGLFGYVTGGSLSNLKLKDVEINAKEAVGALVGNVRGLSEPISNIEGRFIDIQSTHWAGGLIGYSYASVKDCSVDEVNVTLTYDTSINDNGDKAGGITGFQSEGNFYYENCRTSNVEIIGVRDVGGLVGASQYNVYYINCHVEFSVIKAEVNDPSFEHAQPYAGGLIGRAAGSITLFDCSATPGGMIDDVFVPGVIVSSYKAGFAGELVGGPESNVTIAKVLNSTQRKGYETIQVAIDGAVDGENLIKVYPGDHGKDSIDIIQKEGVNITLEAVGDVVLKNQIRISGAGRWNDEETLTIKGFTFDFTDATEAVDIISATKKLLDDTNNYAHNITIENNVFKGNPEVDVVAIRTNGVFGLEIKSSQGIGLHSLGQIQGQSKYFRVIDTTVEGGESGINYYGPADVEITGLTVEGTNYGVRAGQSSGVVNETAKLTISDSNLTALYPVWLRGDAPGTVTITNSTLVHTEGGERIKNDAGVNVLEDPTVYNKGLETYYMTIQEAIDAAVVGENIIEVYPRDYGTDSIEIIQREGVNITLEAVGEVELKNQIKIDGGGRYEAEDTLTIRGFTFDFSDTEGDIITTANIESQDRVYAHNVTFEDCTFIGNKDNNKTVVAVRAAAKGGHTNFAFKNCRGLDLHSMGQLTSVTGFTVEDCTVENASEGGFNLPNCDDITIKNSTVYGTLYGVRTGPGGEAPNKEGQMTVSNSYLEAKYPIWLRKGSPETVVIINTELLVNTEDGERIRNDAEVNVLEDPTVYNKGLETYYMTIQEAIDAAVDGENLIKVYPGNYGTDPIEIIQREGVNITLEAVGEVVLKNQIIIDGEARAAGTESLTIKGFTFDFTDATDAMGVVDIISTTNANSLTEQNYNYSHNVTIEDNIFNGTFDATVVAIRSQSSYNLKIIDCRGEGLFSLGQITSIPDKLEVRNCDVTVSEGGINYTGAGNVTIEALKVVGDLYGVRAGANNEVIYSGSKLVISGSDLEAKYPVIIRGAAETVTITDSTLTPSDDGKMIDNKAGSNVNITIDGATYVSNREELLAALDNNSIETICLADGDYGKIIIQSLSRPVSLVALNQHEACFESIEIKSDDVVIDGVTAGFIDFYGVDDITITNNVVTGHRFSIAIGAAGGGNNGPATITNNIVKNGAIGLMPTSDFDSYMIADNTVMEAQDEGIWIWYTPENANIIDDKSAEDIAEELVNNNQFGDYFNARNKVKVQYGVDSDKIFR